MLLSNSIKFNSAIAQNKRKAQVSKYLYGWHIKDINGLYTLGSVISISIYQKEIILVIEQLFKNNKIATFLKALIRKYLKKGINEQFPDINSLEYIMSKFILLNLDNITIKTTQLNLNNSVQENNISNPLLNYI